jgi:phosphoribosylformylglycinamidine synthase subunit PurS
MGWSSTTLHPTPPFRPVWRLRHCALGLRSQNRWLSRVAGGEWGGRYDRAVLFSVLVETSPRAGVADPEGATIERSLPALGFEGVRDIRVGKAFRFTVDAPDLATAQSQVEDMCSRFLTNPVIEDSTITVTEGATV